MPLRYFVGTRCSAQFRCLKDVPYSKRAERTLRQGLTCAQALSHGRILIACAAGSPTMNLSTGPYPTRDSERQLPEEDDFAELREAAMEDVFRAGAPMTCAASAVASEAGVDLLAHATSTPDMISMYCSVLLRCCVASARDAGGALGTIAVTLARLAACSGFTRTAAAHAAYAMAR